MRWSPLCRWIFLLLCGVFFRRCRPRLGVVLEAEYWPNLLFAGEAAGVRLLLANARLSRRSARRYRRARAVVARQFATL